MIDGPDDFSLRERLIAKFLAGAISGMGWAVGLLFLLAYFGDELSRFMCGVGV